MSRRHAAADLGPDCSMTADAPTDRLRDQQELRLAWREATLDWLDARHQYERLRTDENTDSRQLREAAQTYAFAAHRRALLYLDADHVADLLDAGEYVGSVRASAR
jgi:hypothetical protein